MSGENYDFCKDCLIICIPVTPVGDVVDEDRPELDEPDSEQYQGTPNDNIAFSPFERQAFHKDPNKLYIF